MIPASPVVSAAELPEEKQAPRVWLRRLVRNPLAVVSAAILVVIIVASLLAPWLSPYDPNFADLGKALQPPGADHLLGTDGAGRDEFSRILSGGASVLLAALVAVVVSVGVGVPFGLIGGYYGGRFDAVVGWIASAVMSLPALIVLVVVVGITGPNVVISMAVFGIILAPGVYWLVRSTVRAVRGELYIDAARVAGLSDARIIARHILASVRAPVIIQVALLAGLAVVIQSGLGFLGLGDSSRPNWGATLAEGFGYVFRAPLLIVWPGLAITLLVGALGVLGNALRDALEPGSQVTTGFGSTTRLTTGSGDADAPAPADLLSVQDLSVFYAAPDGGAVEAVRGASLTVAVGEVLGLVGESGSGKTQIALSSIGLLPKAARVQASAIWYAGTRIDRASASELNELRGAGIGYIPQEPMSNLDPSVSIGAQLTRPIRLHLGLSRSEARERAVRLLGEMGIVEPARVMKSYPHQISGGMAQRVLIAGAVSCDPKLLIADEPTTALDVTVQAEILELLRRLQRDRNMGMLLVTHNLGVVADICDRVAVMRKGEIVETATVGDLFADPRHEYTRALLGSTLDDAEPRQDLDQERATREASHA